MSLEKITGASDKSWVEIGLSAVTDGAISYGLGKIPGINKVTKGRNSMNKTKKDSVWPPIIRIILFCAVIILSGFGKDILRIDSKIWNTILGIAAGIIVSLSILGIYLDIVRLLTIHEKKKKNSMAINEKKAEGEAKSIEEVISLLESNDIIEIHIKSNDESIIVLGASSDCPVDSSTFFDKQFYMDDQEDVPISIIKVKLNEASRDGCVSVVSIDGIQCHKN